MLPGDTPPTWPERAFQPDLQPDDRDDVQPPRSGKHVAKRLPIDSDHRRRATHAQPTAGKLIAENSSYVLDDTRGIILDDRVRPTVGIAGQLSRSNAARTATGHRDANLSFMIDDQRDGRLICHFGWSTYTQEHAAQRMRGYKPDVELASEDEQSILRESVIALVAAAGPRDPDDARLLSMLAWMLGTFALRRGHGVLPATWIRHEVIDALILTRTDLTGPTLLTYRSGLRRLRGGLTWIIEGEAAAVRMCATQPPHEPYAGSHLAAIRSWINGLCSAYQRRCATALICLGVGCGLTSSEIGGMRGRDARILPSGTVVVDPPGSQRIIACRREFEADLAALATTARTDQFLFAPERTVEKPVHLISNIVDRMRLSRGVPRLDTRRARSTWIVSLLRDHVPHDVIAKAAGLSSTEALARYMRWVPPISDESALRMM
jgi:hypothetical protein